MEARAAHRGDTSSQERPLVTVETASDLDGSQKANACADESRRAQALGRRCSGVMIDPRLPTNHRDSITDLVTRGPALLHHHPLRLAANLYREQRVPKAKRPRLDVARNSEQPLIGLVPTTMTVRFERVQQQRRLFGEQPLQRTPPD
jgi:hypothetical protein